jgi:hypothetical protein
MITEIEMLKKRVDFLENLLQVLLDRLEDSCVCGDLWTDLYQIRKNNEEEYKTNVARIGCKECMENNQ